MEFLHATSALRRVVVAPTNAALVVAVPEVAVLMMAAPVAVVSVAAVPLVAAPMAVVQVRAAEEAWLPPAVAVGAAMAAAWPPFRPGCQPLRSLRASTQACGAEPRHWALARRRLPGWGCSGVRGGWPQSPVR